MNNKASGVHIERLNSCGYEQVDWEHYDIANIASPVTNDMITNIVLVLEIMAAWTTEIIYVKVLFLHGEFTNNEEPIFM